MKTKVQKMKKIQRRESTCINLRIHLKSDNSDARLYGSLLPVLYKMLQLQGDNIQAWSLRTYHATSEPKNQVSDLGYAVPELSSTLLRLIHHGN
jgi:hypothetical protein